MRGLIKKALFGDTAGPRSVSTGLLRGLNFFNDPRIDTQQVSGLYEREIAGPLRRFASRARAAVDVGASSGFYSLYFAAQPGIARVVACEPDDISLQLLERNLALNGRAI